MIKKRIAANLYRLLNDEILPEGQLSRNDIASVRLLSLPHALQNILSLEIFIMMHSIFQDWIELGRDLKAQIFILI